MILLFISRISAGPNGLIILITIFQESTILLNIPAKNEAPVARRFIVYYTIQSTLSPRYMRQTKLTNVTFLITIVNKHRLLTPDLSD